MFSRSFVRMAKADIAPALNKVSIIAPHIYDH